MQNIEGEYYPKMDKCGYNLLPTNNNFIFTQSQIDKINIFSDTSLTDEIREENQKLVESDLVNMGRCSVLNKSIVDDLRLRLFNIDSDILQGLLKSEESINANLHDNIACAIDAIIYDGEMSGMLTPSRRERIRNWFPLIKQIGNESEEGYALETSFTENTNLFVMKVPKSRNKDYLIHEALVGIYGMNKLRHILPNYMYVYGYVKCSPPAIVNKEVITWCGGGAPSVSYLITENIRDSVSIEDFIVDENTTPLDIVAVIYQVFNALNLAYKYYGYTHYDLHGGNILVRKYNSLITVPFLGEMTNVLGYIASIYVPYIIDYGYSRITVGRAGFGKIGLEDHGIEVKRGFPMCDVYKIIGFVGQKLYTSRENQYTKEKIMIFEKLFAFFGEGTLEDRIIYRLQKVHDWYEAKEKYRRITHDDYLYWLQYKSGILSPVHLNLNLLNSVGIYLAPINTKMSTCKFYDLISTDKGPKDSLEYCEVMGAISQNNGLEEESKRQSIEWLNSKFNASEYFDRTYPIMENIAIGVNNTRVNNINSFPGLAKASIRDLTSKQFVSKYRSSLLAILEMKDNLDQLNSYVNSSTCSLSHQDTFDGNKLKIMTLNNTIERSNDFIDETRKILNMDVETMKKLKLSNSYYLIDTFWKLEHKTLVVAL